MVDMQERLRALSREKQSLLVQRLGGVIGAPSRREAGAEQGRHDRGDEPRREEGASGPSPQTAPKIGAIAPESLDSLSNDEVTSLLTELLAGEPSSDLGHPHPGDAGARPAGPPENEPNTNDTSNLTDDEVAALLADLLAQEGSVG